ncbi:MAG: hypothetical protein ACXVRH_12395, partial [Thermoleophilaceae bacterium]
QRYEATLGTSCELSAYMRLRHASEQVTACDKWMRWMESEDYLRAPRAEHSPLDGLVLSS